MVQFNFNKDYRLENERVMLRSLKDSDFDNLLPYSLNEPTLWQYSLIQANGEENLKKYIDLALNARIAETAYPFIVFDKMSEKYAGSTRFYDFQVQHETTQLGYTWYGKAFQGSQVLKSTIIPSLNKYCKFLLLSFAFEEIGLQRVEFRADNTNKRSIAAMKSIGCKVEGVLRSNCKSLDGRRDSIVLSILKEEWFGEVKQKLADKLKISS